MAVTQGFDHLVDGLLQWLDLLGLPHIVREERRERQLHDLTDRAVHKGKLISSLGREGNFLIKHFAAALDDVDRVIADALVLHDEMQQLVDGVRLALVQLAVGHLDQIIADADLQFVHDGFALLDQAQRFLVMAVQHGNSLAVIGVGAARHRRDGVFGLLNGHRGRGEQQLVEQRHLERRRFAGLVRERHFRQPRQKPCERQEQQRCGYVEQRVEVRDFSHADGITPPREADCRFRAVNDAHKDDGPNYVEIYMNHRRALGRFRGADRRDQRRGRRADVLAEDDRDGAAPGDEPRTGERLEDADRRGRALHRDGDERAR